MRLTRFALGSLTLAVALVCSSARTVSAADLAMAKQAVEQAEKDPAAVEAARTAVAAAKEADPKAPAPWLLAARIDLAAGRRARGDERKSLLTSALASLAEATERDRWDPEPFKWKALVLIETKARSDEYVEALRAAAIRGAGEELTRAKYRAQTGDVAGLKAGDPFPHLTWKNSKGADVKAADLYAKGPVIIELFRSAVWCSYCRKQVFTLDDNREKFAAVGISVVAISPDMPETLADIEKNGWKDRKTFAVPLLCDPEGRQADRIGVLNPDTVRKGTPPDAYGLPFPTTIIVDERGVVVFVKTHGDFRERVKPEEMMAEVVKAREAARPNK